MKKVLLVGLVTLSMSSAALAQTAAPVAAPAAAVKAPAAAAAKADGKQFRASKTGPLASLPADRQIFIKTGLAQGSDQRKAIAAKAKTARAELRAILAAPTFDKNAYLAKEKQIWDLNGQSQNIHNNAVVNVAAQLTPAERTAFADMIVKAAGAKKARKAPAQPKR